MLPNRATMVEMSQASHVVTSPIFSHYHHYHPPPPLCTATTATIKHPSDCSLLGQPGVSLSTPPSPNDTATNATSPHHLAPNNANKLPDDTDNAMSPATNNANDNATSSPLPPLPGHQQQQQQPPNIDHTDRHITTSTTTCVIHDHRHVTTAAHVLNAPHIGRHHRHITTKQKQQEVGIVGKDGQGAGEWGEKAKGRREGTMTAHHRSLEFLLTTGEGNNDRGSMCNPSTLQSLGDSIWTPWTPYGLIFKLY